MPEQARVLDGLIARIKELGVEARSGRDVSWRRYKADGTYVTDMDRLVESELRSFLSAQFPGHRLIGEEAGISGPTRGRRIWVIDPIDGTTNYAAGLPFWAVSVALLDGGIPIWGCVYLPAFDDLFLAERGKGATRNGRPLAPLERSTMEREDLFGITSNGAKRYEFRFPQKLRALGSAAAQIAFVACGNYVGYFLESWHLWDIAAAVLIALEAGVKVTDDRGKEFSGFDANASEHGPPLLFAIPGLHERLLSAIQPR